MSTEVKAEISKKNPYYIPRHRYYELKHFCLQYHEWGERIGKIFVVVERAPEVREKVKECPEANRERYEHAMAALIDKRQELIRNRLLVVRCAKKACDGDGRNVEHAIFQSVTLGLSYEKLKARMDIPCGKDLFYDRYRKFFWMLDKERS